jgi:hypothetical protein
VADHSEGDGTKHHYGNDALLSRELKLGGALAALEATATAIGVGVSAGPTDNADEIAERIESFSGRLGAGMVVLPSRLTAATREMIAEFAACHRLAAIYAHSFLPPAAAWYPMARVAPQAWARLGDSTRARTIWHGHL